MGTPSYMAPEQAKTGDVSPASDMFSLGVLLYFAASGKLPFGEGGTAEVLFRVVYEEPDLSALNDVEPQLRDLILRCMAKDPLQRPNAAGAVALAQNAAGSGAWSPGDAVQWPEALAAQIHERTLAAGRTLPDPSLPEPPLVLPSSDSEPTVFTGSGGSSRAGVAGEAAGRKRHGVLIATISTVAVLALGVSGYFLLRPGSDGAASAAGGQASGSSADGGGSASGAATGGAASAGAGASGSALASGSSSATATAAGGSQSASAGTGAGAGTASGLAGTASAGGGGGTAATSGAAAATSAAASAPGASTSTSAGAGSGTPNKYTAAEVCGSGYQSVASHGISGATIYLLYSNSAGENCVVTLATAVSGKVSMSAKLQVQGGNTGSDSGSYTYYAGPVKEAASGKCVIYGGGYNGQSWSSGSWSYCGT